MGSSKRQPKSDSVPVFDDEFGAYLDEANRDPEFRAAYEDEVFRHKLLDSLVALRKALKLTQSEIAKRMQVRQPTVSGFETEASDPKFSTVQRYARAVGARILTRIDLPADCDWVTPGAAGYRRDASDVVNIPHSKVSEGDVARRWAANSQAVSDSSQWTLGA